MEILIKTNTDDAYLFSTMAKFSTTLKFAAVKSEIIPLFESELQRQFTLQSLEWVFLLFVSCWLPFFEVEH